MPTLSKRFSAIMLGAALSTLFISGCSNAEDKEVKTTEGPDMFVEEEETNTTSQASTDDAATTTEKTATATDTETNTSDPELSEVMVSTGDSSAANNQKSIVTNATTAGTPADTVKKAMNATYYGNVEEAVAYYKVDMADFKQELANTQAAFQKTVDSITLTDTKFNEDETKATVNGELMLKGQEQPTSATYDLQKIDGEWKILGQ